MSAVLTLDQFRVFLAVHEEGSFSAAARRLNRAQSAVSRTVVTLENAVGVKLFDRSRYKPQLTKAGKALAGDARAVIDREQAFQARALSIVDDVEPELGLAVHFSLSIQSLTPVLNDLQRKFPQLQVTVQTGGIGTVIDSICDGTCSVGICAMPPSIRLLRSVAELDRRLIFQTARVLVTAPGTALARYKGRVPIAELRQHTQLVITERSPIIRDEDLGVVSHRVWRLSDFHAKRQFLLGGFGWGTMPLHMVRDDLAKRRLVRFTPFDGTEWLSAVPVYLMFPRSRPLGRAGTLLLNQLRTRNAQRDVQ
jgi:DNA-binding transcriptional LysR family regulator